jgi:hypothetical protein
LQNFADLPSRKIRFPCMDAGRGGKVSGEREIFFIDQEIWRARRTAALTVIFFDCTGG